MNQLMKNKQIMIGGALIIVVLIVGFFVMRGKSNSAVPSDATGDDALQNAQAFPTVDASVVVNLKPDKLKREVTLTISGVPADTTAIDYEMSYLAEGNLPKGVIGTIDTNGKSSVEKSGITLGTCSSGACSYDKGVKSIKVSLKFNVASGAKIFEKEFPL